MSPEIKLTISQNDKIIHTLSKNTETQNIIKSLEEFQVQANAALTKMIEELGDIGGGDCNMEEESDEEDGDERLSSNTEEQNGLSKCKKKKCD